MTSFKSFKKALDIGIALLVCSTSTQAAVTLTTWSFESNSWDTSKTEITAGTAGNQTTATGWGNTDNTAGIAGAEYRTRNLSERDSYGSGVGTEKNPDHATDNQRIHEFILLEFDVPTTLKQLAIGWPSRRLDTDITVMAFTGNNEFSHLTSSHMLNRNPNTTDTSNPTRDIGNLNNVTSSYWLVGTYNRFISGDSF